MRPLWQRWPTIIAIAFFLLNVDLVLMPVATTMGISRGWPLFCLAAFFATVEPMYWNWYAKWVVRNAKRSERARSVSTAFTQQRLVEQIRLFVVEKFDWFIEHARLHAEGGEATGELRKNAVALIRGTHILMTYPLMLFFGLLPSGWPFAIFIQRVFPVPCGFVVFLTANAVKTYAIGLGYIWLPWWGKAAVVLAALLLLTIGTRKIIRGVSTLRRKFANGLP